MRITIDIETESLAWQRDKGELKRIFKAWERIFDEDQEQQKAKALNQKEPSKEEKVIPNPVKNTIKEPVKPVAKPKKEWNDKQKKDIQAIKDAVNAKKALKGGGKYNFRADIDDSLIVYMKDEQHMSLKAIAKELKCCEQTVLNRYNKAKGKKS